MEMEIAKIIYNYSLIDFDKKREIVYVPATAFHKRNITLHDLMLGFSLLSNHGVHSHEQCKGQMERMSGENVWHFHEVTETDIENWKKNGDTEMLNSIETAWRITIDLKKIEAFAKKPKPAVEQGQQPVSKVVLYFTNEGNLYTETKDKTYSPTRDGVPFKVFKYLFENPNLDYGLSTSDMASALGLEPGRLRNELLKLKSATARSLGLKGSLSLIESKKGSGYRLNPRLEIIETT